MIQLPRYLIRYRIFFAFQVGRTVFVDEKGELTLRLELLSYESPDIPEAFLVVQTWRAIIIYMPVDKKHLMNLSCNLEGSIGRENHRSPNFLAPFFSAQELY